MNKWSEKFGVPTANPLEGWTIIVDHEIIPSIEDFKNKDINVVLQKAVDFLQKERMTKK